MSRCYLNRAKRSIASSLWVQRASMRKRIPLNTIRRWCLPAYFAGRVPIPLPKAHAARSRPSGEWNDDDFDVLADGAVVGRILKVHAAPVGSPWMWTLAFGHHEDCTPTHGYAESREAAMSAFAKSWRRE